MCEEKLIEAIEELKSRPPLMQIYSLSANQVYELDYKERKFVFVWPLSSFTLTLEEYGNLAITAQTWTQLAFPQGLRITASGQTNSVQMFVLCTDDAIDPTSASAASGVTIADGANVVEGSTTDAAVVGDNAGTISAKLRGLSKIFNDVWDSVNHFLLVKATQSGTWTVQPGNTANTTAWKVDGSAVTQPTSIAAGADVTMGNTTDAAVVGDVNGTASAKLRGLSKIWNDVWDSANHWLQVKVMNGNVNGQATMANSSPVTLASDQTMPVNVGTPTASAISVGVTSTTVVTPGANAKFLLLINDSPNTIYLNISGGAAALNAGVRLNGNGGSILFDRYIPSAAITAISAIASSNLLVEVG